MNITSLFTIPHGTLILSHFGEGHGCHCVALEAGNPVNDADAANGTVENTYAKNQIVYETQTENGAADGTDNESQTADGFGNENERVEDTRAEREAVDSADAKNLCDKIVGRFIPRTYLLDSRTHFSSSPAIQQKCKMQRYLKYL